MPDTQLMPRLIKTAKKVFRYDNAATSMGWPHDVYYDRLSEVFIIQDFPQKGLEFAVRTPLEDGFSEIEVEENEKYRIRVYEK